MKTYLITGAGGFLGNALIQTIINTEEDAQIIGLVRTLDRIDNDCFSQVIYVPCDLSKRADEIQMRILFKEYGFDGSKIDYIIHCASVTDSKRMIETPVFVMDSIVEGTCLMLNIAQSYQCDSMVYISSMETYGVVPNDGEYRSESELGKLSLTETRSSYPVAKRTAEAYCYMYAMEKKVPVKVARLAQVFGRYSRLDDKRVYMQFAKSVKNGQNIILKTSGESVGNYCATEDAISAILLILKNGNQGDVYNVVNEENTMTIKQMAELVTREFTDGVCEVCIENTDRAETGYARETGLRMSSAKLRELGWKPQKKLREMYEDLFVLLKASENKLS